jgi:hypothetical protein
MKKIMITDAPNFKNALASLLSALKEQPVPVKVEKGA